MPSRSPQNLRLIYTIRIEVRVSALEQTCAPTINRNIIRMCGADGCDMLCMSAQRKRNATFMQQHLHSCRLQTLIKSVGFWFTSSTCLAVFMIHVLAGQQHQHIRCEVLMWNRSGQCAHAFSYSQAYTSRHSSVFDLIVIQWIQTAYCGKTLDTISTCFAHGGNQSRKSTVWTFWQSSELNSTLRHRCTRVTLVVGSHIKMQLLCYALLIFVLCCEVKIPDSVCLMHARTVCVCCVSLSQYGFM